MNITSLVLDAQKELIKNPYDLSHDLQHHYRVFEFTLKIIKNEVIDCDQNIIIASAWLHDINGRTGEGEADLLILLKKHNLNKNEVNTIISSIKNHSYNKHQNNTYEKILYDADKVEYVNEFRLSWFIQSFVDSYLNQERFNQYIEEWFERIDHIYSTLHYDFTRKTFLQRLPRAREIMEKARQMASLK